MPPNFSHQVSFTPPQSFYGRLQFTCHDFLGTNFPGTTFLARLLRHDFLRHDFFGTTFSGMSFGSICFIRYIYSQFVLQFSSPVQDGRLCHYISHYSTYRKWSIKRRDAYLIFPVIGAALVRERPFISTSVKPCDEYRETSVRRVQGVFNLIYDM